MGKSILKISTIVTATMLLAGCASASGATTHGALNLDSGSPASELKLGYFANVTHAPALVGLQEGILQKDLGDTKLTSSVFNAGPATVEALTSGAIDAAYIGPNPAINTFIQSGGSSVRVVSGVTTGGAALVVRSGITSAADLKGKTLATPQLGNTQDVALRTWLAKNGLKTDINGGGDVTISPTDNATTLQLFQDGKIDGAWLPEPWVSRLVLDAGATVLVNEASLWPNGQFPTTVLLVNANYLQQHPQTVQALIQGNSDSIDWIKANASTAASVINAQLKTDTGKALSTAVITRALSSVSFSVDPDATAFQTLVNNGVTAGTQKKGSIDGLFDLRLLNAVQKDTGRSAISANGLGAQ